MPANDFATSRPFKLAPKGAKLSRETENRKVERPAMKSKLCAGDWAAKQKYPLTKLKVRKLSAMQLAEMREAGIKFVSVLGCNNLGDDCEACLAMKGQKIEIEFAAPLPLPGCDKRYCKCIWLAEA